MDSSVFRIIRARVPCQTSFSPTVVSYLKTIGGYLMFILDGNREMTMIIKNPPAGTGRALE
jgi:hypothetical protein